ncbi:MAG: alpha/beta hydrolase [Bacteroidales bacterium]|nr:alpha/beta hydrolase [Bacteroidales bacterium]
MAKINIFGIEIDYELVGDAGAPAVALTPGGRFARDCPGLPELAAKLAEGGKRVLLWDRPSCGASDISFAGDDGESVLHGRVLTQLIRELDLGPTALAAGSAGSRVSLIAASRDPEIISHLMVWWISGGVVGLLTLSYYYCCDHAIAASHGGMEAVAKMPLWKEQLAKNPRNRDILLAQDPEKFIKTMEKWAMFYVPGEDSPVPGMSPADFARLTMPVKIYRNGLSDLSHPRETSDWVHRLIPHSVMVDAPWPDDEWNRRCMYAMEHGSGHFAGWPVLAPDILDFTAS